MLFNQKLLQLLSKKGVTKKQLYQDTGISLYRINNWLKGNSYPKIKHFKILCKYFEVSADYLLGLSD